MTDRIVCVSCHHEIDAAARLCPYCGADPLTGEKFDTQALLEKEFHPRTVTTSESVIDFARQRQGVVITIGVLVTFLGLAALHQFATHRNQTAVSQATAVPLTELTDLSDQDDEAKAQPMPEMQFQYDGHSERMRTLIVEPGAVTPPEVVAAQQPRPPAPQPQQHR